ncbi:hypothetical protein B0H17DRAFT_1132056 [Mycena rosella]|uniref:Uncharacterized protein n=1 Tax=Mycena rosella TaxID=1033263 RepID=A0AAD7DLC0_MYCRO|nr:hypothetical protein B0H17DRAFT_1132056 [Mycena rosella]
MASETWAIIIAAISLDSDPSWAQLGQRPRCPVWMPPPAEEESAKEREKMECDTGSAEAARVKGPGSHGRVRSRRRARGRARAARERREGIVKPQGAWSNGGAGERGGGTRGDANITKSIKQNSSFGRVDGFADDIKRRSCTDHKARANERSCAHVDISVHLGPCRLLDISKPRIRLPTQKRSARGQAEFEIIDSWFRRLIPSENPYAEICRELPPSVLDRLASATICRICQQVGAPRKLVKNM